MTEPRKPRAPRSRRPKPETVEILPPPQPARLPTDVRVLAPMLVLGTATGFAASFIVGGGGLLRHAVVGVLGMLVGQGLTRISGWRINTGHNLLDEAAMAVLGAVLVVLLARFIA